MIWGLRVIVCGSGDGIVIKLHHEFRSRWFQWFVRQSGVEIWFERERRTGFCFLFLFFYLFILDIILWAGIVCECLYSLFKMLTCHYLIGGVNSWFYTKTGPNVTPFLNLWDKIRDMLKSPCMLYWLLLFSSFSFFFLILVWNTSTLFSSHGIFILGDYYYYYYYYY